MRVEAAVFVGIAAFFAGIGTLYWFTSYEDAGTTMLGLAACLALFIGLYLAFTARRVTTHAGDAGSEDAEPYLPHASAWPFFIGVAALVAANGLALGLFALVPGVIALGAALVGYAGQSRRRE